jgi:hypothetical protein
MHNVAGPTKCGTKCQGSAVHPSNALFVNSLRNTAARSMPVVFAFAGCERCKSVDESGDESGLRGEKFSNRPPFSSPISFTGVTVVCARRACSFCRTALRKTHTRGIR